MRTVTENIYSGRELQLLFPKCFKDAHNRYLKDESMNEILYADEILNSLKAIVKLFDFTIKEQCIDIYMRSYISLSGDEEVGNTCGNDAMKLVDELIPVKDNCPLTGYFADNEFIYALRENINGEMNLLTALEKLALTAEVLLQAEYENQQTVEYFVDYCEGNDVEFRQTGQVFS